MSKDNEKKIDFQLSNELKEHYSQVLSVDSYPFIKGGILTASSDKIGKNKINTQR
jgi:hypothetical protein